jgi:hypothetical protein
MSSDYATWGAIADGEFKISYYKPGKSGINKSNWRVNEGGMVNALDGINPNPYGASKTQKDGIFIHSVQTKTGGYAGNYNKNKNGVDEKHGVSEGCLLIHPDDWVNFDKVLNEIITDDKSLIIKLDVKRN